MRRKRRDIEDEGLEMRCRRVASICLKSPGALEARCRRCLYLPQELRRHAVGVEVRKYGGMETGCKRADVVM